MSPGIKPPDDTAGRLTDAGHRQSVGELVRDHERMLHAFLLSRCRDEQEAREVAQEAYVRVLNLAEPGAVSFMRSYLFKTASNIATDRARQRQVRERHVAASDDAEPLDELSPERFALGEEDMRILRAALLELSPKCRRAFLLYRLEGWNVDQIASHLGLQVRMVWRHLGRAGLYCGLRIKGHAAEQSKKVCDERY